MRSSPSRRRPFAVLVWLVGIVLLAGWGEITLHQHPGEDTGHSCAVCGAAHASAVPILVSTTPAPNLVATHGVVAAVAADPRACDRQATRSRAPPVS